MLDKISKVKERDIERKTEQMLLVCSFVYLTASSVLFCSINMIFIVLSTRHHVCSNFAHVTGLCVFCTHAPFPCDLKVPLPQVSHILFGLFLALVLYIGGVSLPTGHEQSC